MARGGFHHPDSNSALNSTSPPQVGRGEGTRVASALGADDAVDDGQAAVLAASVTFTISIILRAAFRDRNTAGQRRISYYLDTILLSPGNCGAGRSAMSKTGGLKPSPACVGSTDTVGVAYA